MTQLPNDLRSYALGALLQGRANFFMDDIDLFLQNHAAFFILTDWDKR